MVPNRATLHNCSLAVLIATSILKGINVKNIFPKLQIVVSLSPIYLFIYLFMYLSFIYFFILWSLSTVLQLKISVG